jgi:DNA-binding NarL/FixJ family response regulator
MTKIALIEDNDELLKNYIEYFQYQDDYQICFSFSSINNFLENQNKIELTPEIILLDINMPGISGIDGITYLKKKFPEVTIVMLTAYERKEFIQKALKHGANGYLIKGTPLSEIKRSLESYKNNGSAISPQVAKQLIEIFKTTQESKEKKILLLTNREKDVAKWIADGLTLKETALKLGIEYSTVNHHLKNIYVKLQVKSKGALIKQILSIN